MEDFSYKYSKQLKEEEYVSFEVLKTEWTLRKVVARTILVVLCISLFFSNYTIGFGIFGIFILCFIYFYIPVFSKRSARKQFHQSEYLKHPITYGMDNTGFWLSGKNVDIKYGWTELKVWQEKDDYLVLAVTNNSRHYYPIQELKTKGLYEQVINLCKANGIEYDNYKDIRLKANKSSNIS